MQRNNKIQLRRLILSGVFFAIGIVLPFFTMQLEEMGDTFLPMHFPVLLCGLLCGWKYGGAVGVCLPFFRSLFFGMPPVYPHAVWMASELAVYGIVTGLIYHCFSKKKLLHVYIALISAMLLGRVAWGISKAVLLGIAENAFTLELFFIGAFLDAIPGIVLQLILIPAIMTAVTYAGKGVEGL